MGPLCAVRSLELTARTVPGPPCASIAVSARKLASFLRQVAKLPPHKTLSLT